MGMAEITTQDTAKPNNIEAQLTKQNDLISALKSALETLFSRINPILLAPTPVEAAKAVHTDGSGMSDIFNMLELRNNDLVEIIKEVDWISGRVNL